MEAVGQAARRRGHTISIIFEYQGIVESQQRSLDRPELHERIRRIERLPIVRSPWSVQLLPSAVRGTTSKILDLNTS